MQHAALAGRRVVLFLSRLDPKKNLEALIDALAASPTLRGGAALLIAGAGEPAYVASLKARAAAAGLTEHTLWLGQVEAAEKQAALAAADVFVLPSFSENFCIAAVEALHAGLPCILGEGVAIAGKIEAAGAGRAVAPAAPALARALETMLGMDSASARAISARARRVAEEHFSPHTMARQLIGLYTDICERSGPMASRRAASIAP